MKHDNHIILVDKAFIHTNTQTRTHTDTHRHTYLFKFEPIRCRSSALSLSFFAGSTLRSISSRRGGRLFRKRAKLSCLCTRAARIPAESKTSNICSVLLRAFCWSHIETSHFSTALVWIINFLRKMARLYTQYSDTVKNKYNFLSGSKYISLRVSLYVYYM